ncbi:MAG: radical SAM protein [Bacteroidota bacterium]|jgi:p-methyltransferase
MPPVDLILVSQSDVANYEQYGKLPLDRIELYQDLVYPRMVYYQGGFRSHLDVLNCVEQGRSYYDAPMADRRRMYNIWNLPGFVGVHLANFLASSGIVTRIINNIDSEWDLFQEAYDLGDTPPLVGVSSTFHLSYSEMSRIVKRMRAVDPKMDILMGGAFANLETTSNQPEGMERSMRKLGVRFVLHAFNSDGDLRDLILARKDGNRYEHVRNLTYLDGPNLKTAKFHTTESRWNPAILNETPVCWDQLNLPFVNRTVQMRTASGCPFACAFCSYPETAHGVHLMDVSYLDAHIQSVLRIPGVSNIIFIDDTFNVPRGRFHEMCEIFSRYDFEWFSFLRCQFIDRDLAHLMKESGCVAVYLGVESANDSVLKNMHKQASRAKFMEGVAHLRDAGIQSVAAFVLGFPGETEKTIQDDIDFVEQTGVEFYTLKEFYYMEHTPVHREREKYGLTGMGAKWKHNTMDSEGAHEAKYHMFREIKSSVFVDPDTSLWHLAYLYDQGFSLEHIRSIQRDLNEVIRNQIDGQFDDGHPAFQRIRETLQGQRILV